MRSLQFSISIHFVVGILCFICHSSYFREHILLSRSDYNVSYASFVIQVISENIFLRQEVILMDQEPFFFNFDVELTFDFDGRTL